MDPKDFNLVKPAYSIQEATELMPFGRTKLLEDINSGKLEAARNGKTVVITAPALVRYITSFPPRKPKSP
ncbi:MAG: hypothetical protein ACREQD_13905 [Candidatus Binataceae bacterium]